jgi:branched-chain amino acid transport system substrate-binding protein
MKKGIVTVLLVSLVMVLVASSVLSQTPKTSTPTGDPIKIGGSMSLTGMYSETAKWVKVGYDYWVEDINKRGGLLGRPVKMTIYDDEGNADKAVTYYERAITVDKVDLVFGGYPGMNNVAVMPLVEKYGKVFVGLGGHMKSFEQGFTYSFGSPPLMAEWSDLSVAGLVDDLIPKADWPKTIAFLTMNNVMGLSTVTNVAKAMEARGIKTVVNETYNLPLSDATPLVSKAKGRGAEILVASSFFDDMVMIMRAAKAMRYNPKIIWTPLASRIPAWMKELGEDGNYVLANTWWTPDLPYPGNQKIIEGAKTKLGLPQPPDFFGLGYIWMYTLELGVGGAGTLDNKKIRDYLRSRPFDLPYGKGIKFDSRGLPPPFNFTVQTRGGKNEIIWPKEVAIGKLVYPRPDWSK